MSNTNASFAGAGASSGSYLTYNWKRVTDEALIKQQNQELADTQSYATWYAMGSESTPSSESSTPVNSGATTTTTSESTIDSKINSLDDNQEKIDLQVIQAQKEAQLNNENNEEKINQSYEESEAERKELVESRTADAEAYYKDNEALIKKQNEELQAIEEEQTSIYQNRIDRDSVLLSEKKNSETALLKAQSEKQRAENEETIRQAKIDVELQKQKSAWGYNKLWLGFSSGIINQSQQIATEGIAKIAEIKATMTFQEATMTAKIADVEFNYSNLVNQTIDTYTDKISDLKKEATNRIISTNQSLLKNSYSKKNEIDEIKEWARTEKKEAERQHIVDIQNVKDKWVEYLKDIQESVANYQKREIGKLDTMLESGTIVNLTPWQIAQKEKSLWIPAGTINAQINNALDVRLRDYYNATVWEWELTWNYSWLRNQVMEEMRLWATMTDAIQTVADRNIEWDKRLSELRENKKNAVSLEEKELQLDYAKYELDKAYKSGNLTIDQYEAETKRMWIEFDYDKLVEDWRQFNAKLSADSWILWWWSIWGFSQLSDNWNALLWLWVGSTPPNGREQCWEYFNDITWRAFPMWDSMADKLKVANITKIESGDWIWRWAVWNAWNATNWHVGIIVWETDTHYEIKSSNIKNDGKISVDLVPKGEIKWFTESVGETNKEAITKTIEEATELWVGVWKNDTKQQIEAKIKKAKDSKTKEEVEYRTALTEYSSDVFDDWKFETLLTEWRKIWKSDDEILKLLNPSILKEWESPKRWELYIEEDWTLYVPWMLHTDEMDWLKISQELLDKINKNR